MSTIRNKDRLQYIFFLEVTDRLLQEVDSAGRYT